MAQVRHALSCLNPPPQSAMGTHRAISICRLRESLRPLWRCCFRPFRPSAPRAPRPLKKPRSPSQTRRSTLHKPGGQARHKPGGQARHKSGGQARRSAFPKTSQHRLDPLRRQRAFLHPLPEARPGDQGQQTGGHEGALGRRGPDRQEVRGRRVPRSEGERHQRAARGHHRAGTPLHHRRGPALQAEQRGDRRQQALLHAGTARAGAAGEGRLFFEGALSRTARSASGSITARSAA